MSMSPARQPLHILRKDAIHLWPETLLSLALLIAFAWSEVETWVPSDGTIDFPRIAHPIIKFLLVIAWLVLTSRLVHDEELVGDRQFWTTRPYTWYSLLGSKVLYLLAFVGIPFLIMQAWVLHHAGLYPTHLVPGLLENLLFLAVVALLPLIALAAVTATFVRYISSVLGGVIYFLVVIGVAAYYWGDSLDAPYLGYVLSGTLIAVILIALILMYWKRKTAISRLLLAFVPLIILLFGLLSPANLLTNIRYPDTSVGNATFDTDPTHQQPAGKLFAFQKKVLLDIPVQVQINGLSDKSFVQVQRSRITIEGPGGYHYTSDWTSDGAVLSPMRKEYSVPLAVPLSVFDRIHAQPVTLHVQFGTQTFQPGTGYSIKATEKPFPIPGNASCKLVPDTGELNCTFPFSDTADTVISATIHDGDCTNPGSQTAVVYANLAPVPGLPYGFTPVEFSHAAFGFGERKVALCPNTQTTFTTATPGAYGRIHLDIPSITLDNYARRIPTQSPTGAPTQR